jgi:hypothetical protein
MICYNVCPNCGQYMYEFRCQAVCARCGVFFDCEDLFPYDEVVTSGGEHFIIRGDPSAMGLSEEASA